ncbi:MAG: ferritin family protein [Chitinispirillia bacterium]|jgi:rubrerythrin
MSILDVAKNIEDEGYAFYKDLSEKTVNKEIKGVFEVLAREELNHKRYFDQLKKDSSFIAPDYQGTSQDAKQIFETLKKNFDKKGITPDASKAYEQALELEKNNVVFFKKSLSEATDANEKKLIKLVLAEEYRHVEYLETLLDLVNEAKTPQVDAEWTDN